MSRAEPSPSKHFESHDIAQSYRAPAPGERPRGAGRASASGGALLQGALLVLGLPFVVAGALKPAYDLTLWVVFGRLESVGVRERGRA
jgi:hypothetical protein